MVLPTDSVSICDEGAWVLGWLFVPNRALADALGPYQRKIQMPYQNDEKTRKAAVDFANECIADGEGIMADVSDDAKIERIEDDGVWLTARVFITNECLEPQLGPLEVTDAADDSQGE